jgi:hypothetical protein
MPRQKATPLTPAQRQLEKDVKRINERINEVAKLVGTNSYAYNQWYAAMKSVIPAKYQATSQHGIMQIARSKDFYRTANTKKTKQAIQRLLGMKTAGQLKKEAKKSLQALGIKKPTAFDIDNRVKIIDKVNQFVSENEDMFYINDPEIQQIAHIKGRRKTYEELNRIIDIYNEKMGRGVPEMIDIFEGL